MRPGTVLSEMASWARDHKKSPVFWLNGLAGTDKVGVWVFADGPLGTSFFCSRNFDPFLICWGDPGLSGILHMVTIYGKLISRFSRFGAQALNTQDAYAPLPGDRIAITGVDFIA